MPARQIIGLQKALPWLLALALLASTHSQASVSARDAQGRLLTLAAPAQRIVALAPHIVENLFSVGAGERIVGAVQYSDYPASAASIPRVGGVAGISLERVVALSPDLVVIWGSGSPLNLRRGLEDLDIDYFVDEIRSLADLRRSLRSLGSLTGQARRAEEVIAEMDRQLEQATALAGTASPADDPPAVFLQVWDQPLQSVGRDHLLNEVIERCGGRSVSAAVAGLAPRISLESVLAADPELIIVESAAQGRHWLDYPQLSAVRQDRILAVDPDELHRPTLRLLAGIRKICSAIAAGKAPPAA